MSKIDYQALRDDAMEATGGSWVRESGEGWEAICCDDAQGNAGFIIAEFHGENATANRKFVQSANPATVLSLLDELDKWQQESSAWQAVAEKQLALAEAAEKRIAELESLTAPQLPQPVPVSVPEVVGWEDVPEEITEDDITLASAWAHGFNQCRASMLKDSEPVTDNTNQQFESLSRGDK